jgi:two-component system, NarL family, response regulator NreC
MLKQSARPKSSASSNPATSATASRRKLAQPTTTPSAGVRVLCVDDHAILVEGLKAQFALDHQITCAGYLSSATTLLKEVSRLKPHIVLLDIEMPGADVFECADQLHHLHPQVRFIFLSAHVRDGYLAAAYKCGASGYFAKGDELEDIISGIKEVAHSVEGIFVMGPKVLERCQPSRTGVIAARSQTRDKPHRGGEPDIAGGANGDGRGEGGPKTHLESLTAREVEVLRLIGKGCSRHDIAHELSRSAKTIDGHQERILKKLDVETRSDLMRFAIREGLAEA